MAFIETVEGTARKNLLISTQIYIPQDSSQQQMMAPWLEYQHPDDRVVGFNGLPQTINDFFNKVKVDLPMALKTCREVWKTRPDAVLAHREATGLPLSALKRLGLLPSELYYYSHSALSDGPFNLKSALTRFGRWDGVICLSEEEAQGFVSKYQVDPSRVFVNPTPIDTEFFDPQLGNSWAEADPFIFSSGVAHRDYGTLVDALDRSRDLRCIIDPSSPNDSLKNSSWLGQDLPSNIEIKSYPSPGSIRDAIKNSQFSVVAIQGETAQLSAGCTQATLAGAMEKPIVAATRGLREYVIDGQTGLLVPPGQPEALAEAIRYLWENPDVAAQMGQRARNFMKERFSNRNWVQRFEQIIQGA